MGTDPAPAFRARGTAGPTTTADHHRDDETVHTRRISSDRPTGELEHQLESLRRAHGILDARWDESSRCVTLVYDVLETDFASLAAWLGDRNWRLSGGYWQRIRYAY